MGANSFGQTNVPAGLSNAVAIAAGNGHNLALRTDGTVVSWGYNQDGATDVPVGLSNVVAIAAGQGDSLALRGDGTVVAWGPNASGDTTIPAGLSNVVAIAAGVYFYLALVGDRPPITQTSLINPLHSNGIFSLSLPTQNGHVYRLEFKDSLADNSWMTSPLISGNGNLQTLTDSAATNSQRFYRVRQW
jgi:hypothetical protein